jgi:hypothetical protein
MYHTLGGPFYQSSPSYLCIQQYQETSFQTTRLHHNHHVSYLPSRRSLVHISHIFHISSCAILSAFTFALLGPDSFCTSIVESTVSRLSWHSTATPLLATPYAASTRLPLSFVSLTPLALDSAFLDHVTSTNSTSTRHNTMAPSTFLSSLTKRQIGADYGNGGANCDGYYGYANRDLTLLRLELTKLAGGAETTQPQGKTSPQRSLL